MNEIIYQSLMSFFACLCFAVVFQVKGKHIFFAGFGGLISWLIYLLAATPFPDSDIPRYFIATVVITIYSEVCARILRSPVTVFLAISLLPLVPGNGIYQTMVYCIKGDTVQALRQCIFTVGIAGALAIGIVVVSSIVQLILRYNHIK